MYLSWQLKKVRGTILRNIQLLCYHKMSKDLDTPTPLFTFSHLLNFGKANVQNFRSTPYPSLTKTVNRMILEFHNRLL